MNSANSDVLVLNIEVLRKKYSKTEVLSDFSLKLGEDKIVGLLGPNGSGKTTLLKIISGLLTKNSGKVEVCGNQVGEKTKADIAFLPDKSFLPDWMTPKRLVKMYSDFYKDFRENVAFEAFENVKVDTSKKLSALSKGNQEKVHLILTMARKAKLYLLDEPIGGVDPAVRDYILNTIVSNREKGSTVFISTHLIADVEQVLDEAVFIKLGKLVLHRNVAELRKEQGKTLDEIFREEFRC